MEIANNGTNLVSDRKVDFSRNLGCALADFYGHYSSRDLHLSMPVQSGTFGPSCTFETYLFPMTYVYTGKRLIQNTEIPETVDTENRNTGIFNTPFPYARVTMKSRVYGIGPWLRFLAWHILQVPSFSHWVLVYPPLCFR